MSMMKQMTALLELKIKEPLVIPMIGIQELDEIK